MRIILQLQQYLPFTVLKPHSHFCSLLKTTKELQQYLPFTVLKPNIFALIPETKYSCNSTYRLRYWNLKIWKKKDIKNYLVATVLTVYGIETPATAINLPLRQEVATVLTVYGIETHQIYPLDIPLLRPLQQYLPFTVLKLCDFRLSEGTTVGVATVLTVYGIETGYNKKKPTKQ